jgi:hypothetical protein
MRKITRLALTTLVAAAALAACGGGGDNETAEDKTISGSFAGKVAGSEAYVAIVAGRGGKVLAYVTDGASSVDWVAGVVTGRTASLSNEGGATLDAKWSRREVTGSFTRPQNPTLTFTAVSVKTPAGLYRAVEDFADGRYVGGWVVLPDGTERGSVRRYETPLVPGEVDSTAFKPGDASFTVPGGVLRPELVRPSGSLSLPN